MKQDHEIKIMELSKIGSGFKVCSEKTKDYIDSVDDNQLIGIQKRVRKGDISKNKECLGCDTLIQRSTKYLIQQFLNISNNTKNMHN
jgi:hypothetical protein